MPFPTLPILLLAMRLSKKIFLAVKDWVATTTQTRGRSMMLLTTMDYSSELLPKILHPLTSQRQGLNP